MPPSEEVFAWKREAVLGSKSAVAVAGIGVESVSGGAVAAAGGS